MTILLTLLAVCGFILIRNQLVFRENLKMIDFFFDHDANGWQSGLKFEDVVPSYDTMMFKFWVWPISSFYPAYHENKKK